MEQCHAFKKVSERKNDNLLLNQYSQMPSKMSDQMLCSSPLRRGSLSWLTLPELWAADRENMLQWQLPSSKSKICLLSVLMVGFLPASWTTFLNSKSLIAYSEILKKRCDWIQQDLKITEVNKDFLVCSLGYSEVPEIV